MRAPTETGTPQQIAARLYEKYARDVLATTKAFVQIVRSNAELRQRITDPLIEAACYDIVRSVVRGRRETLWHMPQPSEKGERDHATARCLLDFPLPDGTLLREATRAQLLDAATFYNKQAINMGVKARWLTLVAKILPNDADHVEKFLDEEKLEKLQIQAIGRKKP